MLMNWNVFRIHLPKWMAQRFQLHVQTGSVGVSPVHAQAQRRGYDSQQQLRWGRGPNLPDAPERGCSTTVDGRRWDELGSTSSEAAGSSSEAGVVPTAACTSCMPTMLVVYQTCSCRQAGQQLA